jgi:hypothetical protein
MMPLFPVKPESFLREEKIFISTAKRKGQDSSTLLEQY